MEKGFTEIKDLVKGLDTRLRMIETSESGCRGVQELRIGNLDTGLARLKTDHEAALIGLRTDTKRLEDRLDEIIPWFNGLKWLAGLLGVSVVGLIWAILTHSITIVVP